MKPRPPGPPTLRMRRAAGLTLIEILVTLSIVAILTAIAVPSFKPMLDRWRVRQSEGAITDTIRLARSEAIKRGGNVVIQKMPDNTDGCTLAPAAADWGCGWQVFVDSDANGSYSAGEEVLLSARVPPGMAVTHGRSAATISVDRWGNMDGFNAKSFVVFPYADGTGSPATRTLCISAGGRINTKEAASC
ncbi:GspH/FimT family pseudopilin [Pantoea sp. 18069]|uniref:GspH/FimT family pseudopilin n=1 Tax=Pantoea sp. 18069 TaxID=2681415 RepID=UPI00190F927E|nr:GspH/FimT family pseudopilin [Pantoea sp. 18069]